MRFNEERADLFIDVGGCARQAYEIVEELYDNKDFDKDQVASKDLLEIRDCLIEGAYFIGQILKLEERKKK